MGILSTSIWYAVLGVIWWSLWNERNGKIFEKFHSSNELVTFIYKSLFEWVSTWASFDDGE